MNRFRANFVQKSLPERDPDKLISQLINFLHKSAHEPHLDESIGFDPVLLRNECMSEIQIN